MQSAEKQAPRQTRVLHGPHRLRVSGIAPNIILPEGDVVPTVHASDSEIAGDVIAIAVEFIPVEQVK